MAVTFPCPNRCVTTIGCGPCGVSAVTSVSAPGERVKPVKTERTGGMICQSAASPAKAGCAARGIGEPHRETAFRLSSGLHFRAAHRQRLAEIRCARPPAPHAFGAAEQNEAAAVLDKLREVLRARVAEFLGVEIARASRS